MKSRSILLLTIALASPFAAPAQQQPLGPAATISFPDLQGGFNHMSVDAERHRLFAAAPTNKTLEVVDLASNKLLRSLEGDKPAAARYAPEFNQLYVARGQSIVIYDGKTLAQIAQVDVQSNLDELQYDPTAKELYVGCMSEGSTGIAVIGLPEGKLLAKIPLPAKPQGIAVERNGTRLFANLPDLKQIAVVDRIQRVVLPPWPMQDVEANVPLALDEAHHRLFIGARRPAQLVVLDTATGKPVDSVNINTDTDDLFYDPAAKRVYVSCGEGFVDVIQQLDADHYRLLTRIPTVSGARTSTLSDGLRTLYVGVPRRSDAPAQILVFKATP